MDSYITWQSIIYYLSIYYILLGHFLYATWGSIIIGVEAIIGVYITLSAPVVLLKYMRCVVVQVWLTNAKKSAVPFVELRL